MHAPFVISPDSKDVIWHSAVTSKNIFIYYENDVFQCDLLKRFALNLSRPLNQYSLLFKKHIT